ncbi:Peptidase family M50 [Candidatus Burarchaeum australiense]|nr:Peptidase family M50 [Candidatus Burarchaeum australiense]
MASRLARAKAAAAKKSSALAAGEKRPSRAAAKKSSAQPSSAIANQTLRHVLSLVIVVAAAALFFWLLDYDVNGVLKFIAIIGLLGLSGEALRRLLGIEGEWGLMLLRTEYGLKKLETLAKAWPGFWKAFCEFGLVFGFGLLSLVMFKGISKRTCLVSLAILLLSSLLVMPLVLPVAYSVISNLPMGSVSTRGGSGNELLQYGVLGLLLVGGVTMAGILGLVANAVAILLAMAQFLLHGGTALAAAAPGAAPIIPGKNIPLLEGILALVIILVVHEGAHGILARLHNIKLKSAGVVLFGILPVGAFVDPDEKQLDNAAPNKQRDVLVAGSTSNFVTMFAAFGLLCLFLLAVSPLEDRAVLVSAYVNDTPVIAPVPLLSVNDLHVDGPDSVVTGLSNLTGGDTISFGVMNGSRALVSLDSNGSISLLRMAPENCESTACMQTVYETKAGDNSFVSMQFTNADGGSFVFLGTRLGTLIYTNTFAPGWGWLNFVYNVLALTFVLNFLIGSVNLFPLPVFDGQKLMAIAVPDKFWLKLITYAIALAFIINLLPWLWR